MKKNLTAVVLAAGSGSRFWPFVTNKVLFPFYGKPLFDFSIRDALPRDVTRLVIVANSQTESYYSRATYGIPHTVVVQQKPKGMADALVAAHSQLRDSRLFIMIADDVFDTSLSQKVITTGQKNNVFGVMPGWKVDAYRDLGYLRLAGEKVTGVVEKPGPGNTPSDFAYISGQYIADSAKLFSAIAAIASDRDDVYEQALSRLMSSEDFRMERYDGPFASLKYPWHVLDVMQLLCRRNGAHRGKHIDTRRNVDIVGDVWIGDNVKIFENTKIVGPCFIGDNTVIGNNCMIRESHMGANCVVGFNTDITRSYIGDDCWFHANFVGDSVLEGNISMGSGAVLANLRLDEGKIYSNVKDVRVDTQRNRLGAMIARNVRIGVNTSVMPGIKIGSNTQVGSGIVIDQDIPDSSFVTISKPFVEVRSNTQKGPLPDRTVYKKAL